MQDNISHIKSWIESYNCKKKFFNPVPAAEMVIILDGNSGYFAHAWQKKGLFEI